jgi:hypothetical protein
LTATFTLPGARPEIVKLPWLSVMAVWPAAVTMAFWTRAPVPMSVTMP